MSSIDDDSNESIEDILEREKRRLREIEDKVYASRRRRQERQEPKPIVKPVQPASPAPQVQADLFNSEYFTGEKSKQLMVHVMHDNIEVDKPIKTQIWKQQVEWKQRVFPISHEDFIIDAKGVHHVFVDANKLRTKRFSKSPDKCIKCGGKMEDNIDARNARDLLKRKTIEAIWGIDSTHIILLMILGIALLAVIGFAFYEYTEQQKLQTRINSAIATNDITALVDKKPQTVTKPPTTITPQQGGTRP